ncbi:hypothetical protein A6R68_10905, partial [Neotoma lepida]
ITILTSQPGKEVIRHLEEGLKDINLLSVRRLQVVEITKDIQEQVDPPSPTEEPGSGERHFDICVTGQGISGYFCGHALLVERTKLALIVHFDEFLTAGGREGDIQLHLDTADCLGGATKKSAKRDWLLLARGEPQIPRYNQNVPASSFYVITPSQSLTLLVKLSTLDSLELGLTYNPLQVESHLYSHLSSTYAKPQGRLCTSWESRGLRKAGQLQTNRVRATVVPLPVAPAPGRAPKMSTASKASSGTFLPSDSEEEYPSQT